MKHLAALSFVALALAACGGDDEQPTVTGVVIAPADAPPVDQLSANAMMTVTLEDVSRADAAATVLSTQTIELDATTTFPVPFELPYNLGDIVERNTYRVAARVASGGDLLMISDTIVPVITRDAPTTGVEVGLIYIADN